MSTLALSPTSGTLIGAGSPPAGDAGQRGVLAALNALAGLKTNGPARTSWVFNDLHLLASECGVSVRESELFSLAQRLLLALPSSLVAPEMSIDSDGEIAFDWRGQKNKMVTITLRSDGRLTYAAYFSASDKDHGTKQFIDAVPKAIIDLINKATPSA